DIHEHQDLTYVPVLNASTLPAIGASACLLAALMATRRLQQQGVVFPAERVLAGVVEVGGVLQLWLVLSVDLYKYCRTVFGLTAPDGVGGGGDDRAAQMALSVLWAVYATVLLAVGFRLQRARLRWTALGLYGVTVGKVFLLDMANLDEIYRI